MTIPENRTADQTDEVAALDDSSKKAWNPPTLQPHDLIPSGGSIAGVSDVSVFHS